MLETMSFLLKTVDEVPNRNGDVREEEAAMEAVKLKKEELQKEIDGRLYLALKEGEEGVVERARGDHLRDIECDGKVQ